MTIESNWQPGVHDPTVMGWVTTIAYFIAAALCWRAWAGERYAKIGAPRFWLLLTVVMLVLGVNKQLDFQTLLIGVGRSAARGEGWYERRRLVQAAFVVALASSAIAAMAWVLWWVRFCWRRYLPALLGMLIVAFFVLLQAASFDHVQDAVGARPALLKHVHVLELAGILLVAWGAMRQLPRIRLQKLDSSPA
jgi:hypothetical protein